MDETPKQWQATVWTEAPEEPVILYAATLQQRRPIALVGREHTPWRYFQSMQTCFQAYQ